MDVNLLGENIPWEKFSRKYEVNGNFSDENFPGGNHPEKTNPEGQFAWGREGGSSPGDSNPHSTYYVGIILFAQLTLGLRRI